MKVLFDTNVIIDILKHDNDHFLDSLAAYDLCTFKRWDICIAATQVPDLEYLFLARNITGRDTISQYMHHILECFDIVDVAKCDCVLALADQMENTPESEPITAEAKERIRKSTASTLDLEDGIILHAAKRHSVDSILSWDQQFALVANARKENIPVISPAAFVSTYKPANITYQEIDF